MRDAIRHIFIFFTIVMIRCSESATIEQPFDLVIESAAFELPQITRYHLSQDSLKVLTKSQGSQQYDSIVLITALKNDSLQSIYYLNPKSYSCDEQHGLDDAKVKFIRNDTIFIVNPGVNHPKELDFAVRIINSALPENYRLQFEDLQPAIFQTDDHSM